MGRFSLSEGIEIATKLAVAKCIINSNETISVVLHNNQIIELTEEDKSELFESIRLGAFGEPIIKELYLFWAKHESDKVCTILKSYYEKAKISFRPSQFVCKLYFETKPEYVLREDTGRSWIDYQKQINWKRRISDTDTGNGLWTTTLDMFHRMINNESFGYYGTNIMILKTLFREQYILSSKKEIIGDKFKYIYHGRLDNPKTWLDLCRFLGDKYYESVEISNLEPSMYNDIIQAYCAAFNIKSN